ncbi:DUF4073 domain-containing protein [Vallitalea pronyensis]|uniref:DUF4073 domain-containing protein n=1 Tax=Vallitalea pronyensis TaxID=1348613 RepID=A0A8J8SHZ5_9FIRM|nr:DUF4073 domain-containing protein [Vallitalea pronyensis]QUI23939.1 DUF4073 domain-containing protein [Vallitalea pronyensis]
MRKLNQTLKRLFIILLASITIISNMPSHAFAEEVDTHLGHNMSVEHANDKQAIIEQQENGQASEKITDNTELIANNEDNTKLLHEEDDNDGLDSESNKSNEEEDSSNEIQEHNEEEENLGDETDEDSEEEENLSDEINEINGDEENLGDEADESNEEQENLNDTVQENTDETQESNEEETLHDNDLENLQEEINNEEDIEDGEKQPKVLQAIQSLGTIKVVTTLKKYQHQGANQYDNRGEIKPGDYDYYDTVDSWYQIKSGNQLFWINTEWLLNQGGLKTDKNLICYVNTDDRRLDKTPQGQLEERGMVPKDKMLYYSKRDGSFYLIQQHLGSVWVNIDDLSVSYDAFMPTQGHIELEYGRKYYDHKYDAISSGILTNNDNHNPNINAVSYYYYEHGNGWMLIHNFNGQKWIKLNETPVTSTPPDVMADDKHDVIVGNDSTKTNMEYTTDKGNNWSTFEPSNPPTFHGDVTVNIRFKSSNNNPASDITELKFKYNYQENFSGDKQVFDDIISHKRGYLNVKHYEISEISNGNPSSDPALDSDERHKMFGAENYDGYKYQKPRQSKKYAETDKGSLYFYQKSNGSHTHDAFHNAINMWGYFVPEKTGYYHLIAYVDDGVYGQVTVNNQDVVFADSWRYQAPREVNNHGQLFMEEGKIYPIYMDYFDNKKDQAAFELRMKYNNGITEEVPSSYLYPTTKDLSDNKKVPVSDIDVEPKSQVLNINESQTVQLVATIIPSDATNKHVTWSSDNEAVAIVNANGLVTALSIGTANITATSEDGNHQDVCTLTVTDGLTGDPNKFFYANDNRGTLVKYYPFRSSDKSVVVAEFIGNYRDIATLPDGTLVGITQGGSLYKDIDIDATFDRYLENGVNALTADVDGNLYFAKQHDGIIKKYDMQNNDILTIIDTGYKAKGDLVFLDKNTLYYTGYKSNKAFLIKVDISEKQVTNLGKLSGKPYGIAVIDNNLFVAFLDKGKSYVDVYDPQGNKLSITSQLMQYMKQVHGAAQGINKVISNAPVAKDVIINGIAKVGETLTGVYTYHDAEGDEEGNSIFQWYANTGKNQSYELIEGAYHKTFVIPNRLLGYNIKFEVTPIAKTGVTLQGNPVKSQFTNKVSVDLVGPYDYDYFYLNAKDGDLVKYYPKDALTEDVTYTNKVYLDIANSEDTLFGINNKKLFKNIQTQPEEVANLGSNTVNALTYNNGLFYYVNNLWLMAYHPTDKTFHYLKYLGYNSNGDLVAYNGDMYYLAANGSKTNLIKIDFSDDYATTIIGTYSISNLYGVAVANNTLFVAYGKNIAKVNVSNGRLYDEQTVNISNIVYGAAQGGYYDSVPKTITINGKSEIDVPTQANSPINETYIAVVKDQYGNIMTNQDVEWSLQEAIEGISIDANGKVTVTNKALAIDFTIIATSGSVTGSKVVNLNKASAIVTSVIVNGLDEITVPTEVDSPTTSTYTAEIKDQYGNIMTGQEVNWSLQKAVEGVSIDANGQVTVTNKAPGTQFTIIATSGSVTDSKLVSLNKASSIVTSVTINGLDEITVPAEVDSATTSTYTAEVKDQYGNIMIGEEVEWSIKEALEGVSIEDTGKITVTNKAPGTEFSVIATSGSVTDSKVVNLNKATAITTSVTVNGLDEITVPTEIDSPTNVTYTAVIKDQYGDIMTEEVTWSLKEAVEGVSIDANGQVSITNKASGTEFTVIATNGSKTGSKAVNLKKAPAMVASVTVNGLDEITVPTELNSPISITYTAEMKDQYGNIMTEEATWSLKEAIEGISIDETGKVSVTNKAPGTEFTVIATSGSVTDSKLVNLKKAPAIVTSVVVNGLDEVTVPIEVNSPTTSTYTAEVKDQYGNIMANQDVEWSLQEANEGVSVDDTGKVTVTNKAPGTEFTVIATGGSVTDSKLVSLNKASAIVTSVVVNGLAEINVPTELDSPTTSTYTTEIKDQYGNIMTNQDVEWSLQEAIEGVNVDATGKVTVTNKALGTEFTIIATSGSETGSKVVNLKKAPAIVTSVVVNGLDEITVPTELNSPTNVAYTAIIKDQYGNIMTEEVTWSLKEAVEGVSIDATGQVTVTNKVPGTQFTVIATSGSKTGSKSVNVNKAPAIITSVVVNGLDEITVPTELSSPTNITYTAEIKDQYGDIMTEEVTWSLIEAVEGVSIDATGQVTITNKVPGTQFTIIATSGSKTGSKSVNLNKAPAIITSVVVNGLDEVTVPIELESPTTSTYTAEIKDQYGNIMTNQDVKWSLQEAIEGVNVDDTGKVTVTNKAPGAEFTIIATSGSETGSKVVNLKKAPAIVTSVVVNGLDEITVPTQLNSPTNVTYTAIIKDQYGNIMTEEVTWSLKEAVEGVSIDANGKVSVTNKAPGTEFTVRATSGSVTDSKLVNLNKAPAIVTSVTVNGLDKITVPTEVGSPSNVTYTAIIKDQYGNIMTGQEVNWSLQKAVEGVGIDAYGQITVTNKAPGTEFIVIATSGSKTGSKAVNLKKASAIVTSVTVNGLDEITIPTEVGSPSKVTYTAIIKDQYGNIITNQDVEWSLQEAIEGVSADDTGKVTVTNKALGTEFTVIATSGSITDSKVVNLNKASSIVTSVVVNGLDEITVPTELNSPKSITFTAEIKDQYGDIILEEVTWSLKKAVEGVSIDAYGQITVTNKAPGKEFTVIATSESETGSKVVNLKRVSAIVTSIAVNGLAEITVPIEIDSPTTSTYTAEIKDQYGSIMTEEVTWSLKEAIEGVTIDANGQVSITNKAPGTEFTVIATSGSKTGSKLVQLKKAPAMVANVTVNGLDEITVPTEVGSPSKVTYTAIIRDQYGNIMTEEVIWSLKEAVEGVSIDVNGQVSITNKAPGTDFTVIATSGSKTGSKSVNLNKAPAIATSITVNGLDEITVPTENDSPKSIAYAVEVKDQYGSIMTGQEVNWSLKEAVEGVSIDNNGEVTVTNKAPKTQFTIIATNGNKTGSKSVNLKKAPAILTSVTINGLDEITVPKEVDSPTTSTYTAEVKDQYGNIMINQEVTWSLKEAVEGVSIEDTGKKVTVTNKAPGTEFTVIATSGSVTDSKVVNLNKATAMVASVTVNGLDEITVPTEINSPSNVTYTAIIKDQYGNIMLEELTWSLKEAVEGVSIDANGQVTVTNKAPDTDFTIIATSGSETGSKVVNLKRAPAVVTSIAVNGLAEITVPTEVDSPTISTYTAEIKNQYGNIMTEEVIWSLKEAVEGVSIDAKGQVTVTNKAPGTDFTVIATSGSKTGSKSVNLNKAPAIITSVVINGLAEITVPIEVDSPTTSTYTAEIKDQYGNIMTEEATWSLKEAVEGVSIDANGKVTVTNKAPGTEFTVIATSGSVTDSKLVNLNKASSIVTSVVVNGLDEITVPIEVDSPTTSIYTAEIKNQYGNIMTEEVTWSLKEAVEGISIDETGKVTVTNKAPGTEFTIIATSRSVTDSKLVSLKKAPAIVTSVTVNGLDEITVPTEVASPSNVTYTAIAKDQYGNIMTNQDVEWSLQEAIEGISVDATGKVTVTNKAPGTEFTIIATSGSETGSIVVNLKRASSIITSVTVDGLDEITVPTEIDSPTNVTYVAEIKDQYGNIMTGEEVTWSLQETVEGVSIDANGEVSVTNKASGTEFTVIATSGSVTDSKLVNLNKATAMVASVTVNGLDEITVPTEVGSPSNVTYTAIIKDQYGDIITEEVTWSLKEAIEGVSIDANGQVTVTNKAPGTELIIIATSGSETGSKVVNLKKAPAMVASVTINGLDEITVPTEIDSPTNVTYVAVIKDQYGNIMTGEEITWSLKEAVEGVSIDANGQVSVTNKALGTEFTVIAKSGSVTHSKLVNLNKASAIVTSVTINGLDEITVPRELNSPTNVTYVAVIKDQYGNIMTGEEINWSLKEAVEGISIDANGKVTLTNEAPGTEFSVIATSGSVTDSKLVNLNKASSIVTSVVVNGLAEITVPTEVDSPTTSTYITEVKDQYGNIMTGEEVTWSLKEAVEGISIDATGKVSVTNKAPGTEFTVIATSGSVTDSKLVNLKKASAIVTSVIVNGLDEITVPTELSSPTNITYTAEIKDQYGNIMTEEVTWSLKEAVEGASIDANGQATITNKAPGTEFTIIATSGSVTDSKLVNLKKAPAIVTSVVVNGLAEVTVPIEVDSPTTSTYTAEVKDQYGNIMTGEEVNWSLQKAVEGVSIDANGQVTVTNKAPDTDFTIIATSGSVTDSKLVSLNKAPAMVSSVTINGLDEITVPTEVGSPTNVTYVAVIKDQYGNIITGEEINWSLQKVVEGVSIDNTGKVTLTNKAPGTELTVIATSGSVTDSKVVNLKKATAMVASVTVNGLDEITVPTEIDSPSNVTYTAIIKDQYGNIMIEEVTWSLKEAVEGVSIDANGQVTVTNKAPGTEFTIIATSGSKTGSKSVNLNKAPAIITSVVVNGLAEITVPIEVDSPTTSTYTAEMKDQYGNIMTEEVTWSLKEAVEGVSIDTNGQVTLTNKAPGTEFTVIATSGSVTYSKLVSLKKASAIVTSVTVDGLDEITVPTELSSPTTVTYTAEVKDQYGNIMIGQKATWSLKESVEGVSIDATGQVTVTNKAPGTQFTIIATSGSITDSKLVNLKKAPAVATSITVNGLDETTVPTEINNPTTVTYTTEVKDQYGNIMTADTVKWSFQEEVSGVSIDGNGMVTITNDAPHGSITVTANIGELVSMKNVNLNKAPSVTGDDNGNLLNGADETMEYSTNGGTTWTAYDDNNVPTFLGSVTVYVRYQETPTINAGPITEVVFTKNTPSAPYVTGNDSSNILIGADDTMEYSTDGGSNWIVYNTNPVPKFSGNVTVKVRYKSTIITNASPSTVVVFTANASQGGDGGGGNPSNGGGGNPSNDGGGTPSNGNGSPSDGEENDDIGLEEEMIIEEDITPLGAVEFFDPYVKGFPDGSFKPKKAVTRAEVAAMFARILKLDTDHAGNNQYTDVTINHWSYQYIQAVTNIGLFRGYSDGTFRPNAPIKRSEIAVVFSAYWEYVGAVVDDRDSTFIDVKGHWAEKYINKLYNAGVVKGFGDNTFRPNMDTAREQIVIMMNKIIARPMLDLEEPSFEDVSKEHWANGDIEAAAAKSKKKENIEENN